MEGWHIPPEQAQTVKLAAAGGFGAAVPILLRRARGLSEATGKFVVGLGGAVYFGPVAAPWLNAVAGADEYATAVVVGSTAAVIWQGVLNALDKFDFAEPVRRVFGLGKGK